MRVRLRLLDEFKKHVILVVFMNAFLPLSLLSKEKDTLIEIWKGSTLDVLYNHQRPKHKLIIENGVVYREGLFRKNLGSADSLLQLIRHPEVFENLRGNDSIECNMYEWSVFIRYSFEKEDRSLQTNTYFFSYPIHCVSEEKAVFLRKVDAVIRNFSQ